MLDFKEKIQFFASILNGREVSYADSFNADLDIAGMNYDYSFLKRLNSGKEIVHWIDKLKSRIVMREDGIILEDIIDDYISCG